MRTLLLTVSLLALSAPAFAQGMPLPPMGSPLPPMGGPARDVTPGPAMPAPRPLPPLPSSAEAERPVGSPAAMPAQPEGGFTALPTGAEAPSNNRQNLAGANGYVRTLQDDGAKQLGNMTQGVTSRSPSEAPKLDSAPIANQSDLEAITAGQRNIVVLKQKVEEAKLAVELWHVLYNNEDAKALREKDEKAAEARAVEAKAKEKEAQSQAAITNAGAAMASAMRNLAPVAPQVVEVNGPRALLLVQGAGEVWAKAGTRVEGGWKVVSVAPKGVQVISPKGERQTIGYGSTVSSPPVPQMPPAPPAARVASPAPRI